YALLVHGGVLGRDTQILPPGELPFTAGETAALAGLHGLELPSQVQDAIVATTGGWAMGVALALRSRLDGAYAVGQSRDVIGAYFAHEVLANLPDDMRRFLLESAHLAWFTVRDADTILERADSQ